MALFFEFDFFIKSCRHFIGIVAWTWAIFVFCLSYIGRGHYNHINNRHEYGPPPLYQTVFVPVLKVLLVAPSSLSGNPVHPHQQGQQGHNYPWGGQGLGLQLTGSATQPGGFVYCAGCGPIHPQQLVFPVNRLPAADITGKANQGVVSQKDVAWPDQGAFPVQQMTISDDGSYSFSYNTADASRSEERDLGGSVSGSYSYTDPEGKLVEIQYTAGPSGYKAYGDNIHQALPPYAQPNLPQPVQDTPEVQAARQQFLNTYNRELERIQKAALTSTTPSPSTSPSSLVSSTSSGEETSSSEVVATTVTPSADGDTVEVSGEKGSDHQEDAEVIQGKSEGEKEPLDNTALKTALDNQQPIALPVPVVNVGAHGVEGEGEDEHADSVVIDAQKMDDQPGSSLPNPAYTVTIPIGVGGSGGVSVQNNGVPVEGSQDEKLRLDQQPIPVPIQQTGQNGQSNLQPYFYYVSVGGAPHYVTSSLNQPGYRSPYPTSLQATLLNALPLAAVHDTQVPNNRGPPQGPQDYSANSPAARPVFLDLGNSVQQQPEAQMQTPQMSGPHPASTIPFRGSSPTNMNSNQIHQLPFGIFPQTATFGYIPALFVNTGGQQQGQHQFGMEQGSQKNSVIVLSNNNVPEQTNPQTFNQPLLVISKKK